MLTVGTSLPRICYQPLRDSHTLGVVKPEASWKIFMGGSRPVGAVAAVHQCLLSSFQCYKLPAELDEPQTALDSSLEMICMIVLCLYSAYCQLLLVHHSIHP